MRSRLVHVFCAFAALCTNDLLWRELCESIYKIPEKGRRRCLYLTGRRPSHVHTIRHTRSLWNAFRFWIHMYKIHVSHFIMKRTIFFTRKIHDCCFSISACHVKSYAIFPSLVPPGEVQEEPRRLRSQGLSLNFAGEIIIISSLLWHFLKVCPFNASHHVPAPEVDFHVRTCSDRKVRLALFLKPASILTWCQGGGDGEVQLVDAAAKAAWKLEVAGEWGLSCRKKTLDCYILLCLP